MCLGIPARICALRVDNPKLAQVEWWPAAGLSMESALAAHDKDHATMVEINLSTVLDDATPPHSLIGCWVITHLGFAIRVVDEQEAALIGSLLAQLAEARQAPATVKSTSVQSALEADPQTSLASGGASCMS